jgi:hypothetical protein
MDNGHSQKYNWAIPLDDETFNDVMTQIYQILIDDIKNNPTDVCPPILHVGYISDDDFQKLGRGYPVETRVVFTSKVIILGENELEKKLNMVMEGKSFASSRIGVPVVVVLSTEAWIWPDPAKELPGKIRHTTALNPEEAIILTGATASGKTNTALLHIDRLLDNTIIVTDTDFTPYDSNVGNLSENKLLELFIESYHQAKEAISVLDNSTPEELKAIKDKIKKAHREQHPNGEADHPQEDGSTMSIDDIFD